MSGGLTLYGETRALEYLLRAATVYGRLHIADAVNGTMNLSQYTTRSPMTFGAPDSNGVFDLASNVSWGTFTVNEKLWGISIWDAATVGNCILVRPFSEAKGVFVGDTLTLESLPISLPVVGL